MFFDIKSIWQMALALPIFRKKLSISIFITLIILVIFPYFFGFIQQQNGRKLNDWLLAQIPSMDMSLPVFLCIWASALLLFWRLLYKPQVLLNFLIGYIFLTLLRFATILLFPLEPPANLIALADPIANYFYGDGGYITKDLFFSGHTSTLILIFLNLEKKTDRIFSFIACVLLAIFLLIQHVHYTIDVLAAPFFTYLVWVATARLRALSTQGLNH